MSAEFARVREVFEEALDLPEGEREAWVRATCADREDVLRQVLELLGHEPADDFLDSPLGSPLGGAHGDLAGEHDLAGTQVGSFRIQRTLGRGGMGSVYLAEQQSPRRLVALKILAGLPSTRARRRFEVEAELLATLSHPAIAQVHESGSVPVAGLTLPYFAMEHVEDARALPDYARLHELGLRERIDLFLEFCDAVQYGHQKGVLHRDLKPANLLVDGEGRAKVIDFGIARATGSDDGRTQLTSTGEIVGTLAYMAPERLAEGENAGDAASDVYSLGGVLYELLCGERAVSVAGLSLPEAIRHVAEARVTPPRQHRPDLPRELSWIVLRAMEPEPSRRYPTVAALAADLRAFLRHEPVAAGPPSASYRLSKFVRRNRAGVAVAVVVLATVIGAWARVASSREQQRLAEERSRADAVRLLRVQETDVLADLSAEAEGLYPRLPQTLPRYEEWLERAGDLAGGLARAEAVLAELASSEPAGVPGTSERVNRWLRDSLEAYAVELRAFHDPDSGLVADVRRRAAFAATIEERSVAGAEARRAWADALEAIGDAGGPYGGLDWEPQIGLLPLGPDPDSGLWEFAHLPSGAPVERDAAGRLGFAADSCIVLVLLPGGVAHVGAARTGYVNVDPETRSNNSVLEVDFEPFLLSKQELTQAQWSSVNAANPSGYAGPRRPVESVDWNACRETLRRLDLGFPTEAQWEYALRAGTTTPYWTGGAPLEWERYGNLFGKETVDVGGFLPNPFGLHDLSGNVGEWCMDVAGGDYAIHDFARESTGELLEGGDESQRIYRGAFLGLNAQYARLVAKSWWRMATVATTREINIGLRPARALDGPSRSRRLP